MMLFAGGLSGQLLLYPPLVHGFRLARPVNRVGGQGFQTFPTEFCVFYP